MTQIDDNVVRVSGGVSCYVISGSWHPGFSDSVYKALGQYYSTDPLATLP